MKKRVLSSLLAILLLFTLVSCASYDKEAREDFKEIYTNSSGSSIGGYDEFDMIESEEVLFDKATHSAEPEAPMQSPSITNSPESNVTVGRKIIYSANLTVETKEYDKSIASLDALCTELGAWCESTNSYGTAEHGNRTSYYTLRIPVENYKEFLSRQNTLGVIISSSENNRDVTEQYTDTEARLQSATLREERVLKILENADRLDDVLALERELADIRYEIESLTGSLRKYDSLVSYSTVSISINEVTVITPTPPATLTFGERLAKAFKSGIENFKDGVEDFIVAISYNFIGTLFWLAIIVIAVIVIIVKIKKRKAAKKESLPKETKEEKADTPETKE